MLTVMTWNLENLERPAAAPAQAQQEYAEKLDKIAGLIAGVDPDLLGVQEVLASQTDLAPRVFAELRAALSERTGSDWNGMLSRSPDSRGIRVGWLSRRQLADPVEVAGYPAGVPPVVVDDAGIQIGASKRGALGITYIHSDGLPVFALTAHFKSKLLTFPGRAPGPPRYNTDDEGERPATVCTRSPSAPRRRPRLGRGLPAYFKMPDRNTGSWCAGI